MEGGDVSSCCRACCRFESFWKYLKDSSNSKRHPEASIVANAGRECVVGSVVRYSAALSAALAQATSKTASVAEFAGLRLTIPFDRKHQRAGVKLDTERKPGSFMTQQQEFQRALWAAHPHVNKWLDAWTEWLTAENARRAEARRQAGKGARSLPALRPDNPLEEACEWVREQDNISAEHREILEAIFALEEVDRYNGCVVGQRYLRGAVFEQKKTNMNRGVYMDVRRPRWLLFSSLIVERWRYSACASC